MGGGEMIHAVKPQTATWAEPPHKFEAGTPPVAGAVAMGAALRYIQDIGFDVLREHVHSLHSLLQEQCRPIDRVEWLRPPCGAGGIAAFNVRGVHPHDVAQVCSDRGVAIRAGHMCAQPYVQQLGYEALCRASLYIYNDEHDIEQLADALRAAVELFAP
jgi:cysteine desulfurase/selenocysteine lyase